MIIETPTALYSTLLPRRFTDKGNITFTISSNNPPPPRVSFLQLLYSEEQRRLPDKIYTPEERAVELGELIFTVSAGGKGDVGTGSKLLEIGQLLEFTAEEQVTALAALQVPEIIEIQQNTNVLDLSAISLTESEADHLTASAKKKFDELIQGLIVKLTSIADTKIKLRSNQQRLNEARKALDASKAVFGSGTDGSEIVAKLEATTAGLVVERDSLIAANNTLTEEAQRDYAAILQVKEVAR